MRNNLSGGRRGMAGRFVAAAVIGCCGLAFGADDAGPGGQPAAPAAAQAYLDQVPGLHTTVLDGRVLGFWGMPMNSAKDPRSAADAWLAGHDTAFGLGTLRLVLDRENELDFGRFTLYAYHQELDGLPVEFGLLHLLVLNTGGESKVVSVAGRLAAAPKGGFAPDAVDAAAALKFVQSIPDFSKFVNWSAPEPVVYYGEGDLPRLITPARAWKFTGEFPSPDGEQYQKKTFFVGAADSRLLYVRNEKLGIDVTGHVQAMATPAPLGNAAADWSGNPPQLRGVPQMLVQIVGGSQAYTDANGDFTIPNAGSSPVTLQVSVGSGRWVNVADQGGTPLITASTSATPGTPATLTLNPTPGQFTTAQANAFIYQTLTHNHFRDRAPTFTGLDSSLRANTAVSGTCNAFYDGSSTNFYNAGGNCNNTAFSSVISHEYGHHIVNQLGLAQGAFGEGFGDTMSMMVYDDPVIGRYFGANGGVVRLPVTDPIYYPCDGTEVHYCGEIIGKVMWALRQAYVGQFGLVTGRDMVRQAHVDWAQLTNGGQGNNSAHPTTLVEWLTIDDNDGNINNGTPNYCMIVNAFAQAHIPEPTLTPPVAFSFPDGRPLAIAAGAPFQLRVNVGAGSAVPTPNSAALHYRSLGQPTFTTLAMTQGATNQYTATIPGQACSSTLEYYVTVGSNAGQIGVPYAICSQPAYTAFVGAVVADNMETNQGWTVDSTATTGRWERGDPQGTAAQPEDAASPVNCWATGLSGGALGDNDVDGGYTRLISPTYNLAAYPDAEVRYQRWYSNNQGAAPGADIFYVDVSTNNGSTWTRAQTIGPGGAYTTGGWIASSFTFSFAGITPSAQTKLRFTAEDINDGSLVEAAIDDLLIVPVPCVTPPTCPADYNNSGGTPDDADVAAFFTDWNNGDSRADLNGSGGTPDDADVAFFFLHFDAGC